ncbi:MAG: asparagine synthase-related protein [Candidatus Thorarchaeota archaeon]
MAGIAGAISDGTEEETLDVVERMSMKLSHRGEERTFRLRVKNDCLVVIKTRSRPLESLIVKEDIERIVIVEGGEQANSLLISVNHEGLEMKRKLFSMKPLYYFRRGNFLLFSSERKALWEVGIQNVTSLQPGQNLKITGVADRIAIRESKKTPPSYVQDLPHDEIIRRLEIALRASFTRIRGRRVGVLFSGGVDSSLIALLAKEACKDVQLYSASSAPFHDRLAAASAADALCLNLNGVEINTDDVWEVLPRLLYSIESANLMDVEISLPFYLASRQASNDGISLMLSGQGPDELFAGYARHVRIFKEDGEEALDAKLWQEVMTTHENNIERDERAIAAHGLEAFFPYLSTRFIELGLGIPSRWKVHLGEQPERKVIFRELAQQLGLPESIHATPKKATQYSSGSSRILMKSLSENVKEMTGIPRKEQRREAQKILYALASEIGVFRESTADG